MKTSHATNDYLIDLTRKVWQPRAGRDLTDEDVRQITENVTGFFSILTEWSAGAIPRSRDFIDYRAALAACCSSHSVAPAFRLVVAQARLAES
jgi:hypothetical protein